MESQELVDELKTIFIQRIVCFSLTNFWFILSSCVNWPKKMNDMIRYLSDNVNFMKYDTQVLDWENNYLKQYFVELTKPERGLANMKLLIKCNIPCKVSCWQSLLVNFITFKKSLQNSIRNISDYWKWINHSQSNKKYIWLLKSNCPLITAKLIAW